MTSPDPTGPNDAVASRPASRTPARRLTKAGKDGKDGKNGTDMQGPKPAAGVGDAVVNREPRVTVSKASSSRRPARSGDGAAAGGDDVLDRLAQLGIRAPMAPADEPIAVPVIVEADPTYPPLASVKVPADVIARVERDDADPPAPIDAGGATLLAVAATIPGSIAGSTLASTPVSAIAAPPSHVADRNGSTVSTDTTDTTAGEAGSVASAVSADLPTGLVVASPETAPDVPSVGAVGIAAGVLAGGAADAATPTIDRTDVVPLTEPLTEPLIVPDVVPQDVPYPTPIPMAPNTGQVVVDESTGMTLPVRGLRAPTIFRRAKPRVRRVTRVVRHVDTWSVFKVALVFNVILYLVCLTSGVLLWNVAHATGTIDNVEKFFEQFGWESFEFKGGEIYHNAWTGGLFVAVGLTGFVVLLATLFNLITDLVGGIRVSVLEEEVIARPRGGRGDQTGGSPRS